MTAQLSPARRRAVLAVVAVALMMVVSAVSGLNVALPDLARSTGASQTQLTWIVDAYTVVFAGLLLSAGALGDRYGRKRLMLAGLALFGASSLVAALFDSVGPVIWARAAMGLGAAVITPIALAVLPILFSAEERGKAISFAMMGMGVGIPLGPIVGGYLLEHFWWGSIFLINVVAVLVALAAGFFLIPASREKRHSPLDPLGALLSIVGLSALVYGIIEAPDHGWASTQTIVAAGFFSCHSRAKAPMWAPTSTTTGNASPWRRAVL